MRKPFTAALAGLAAAAACWSTGANAQAYPTRPITMVVPFAAGGPTDVVARTLDQTTQTIPQIKAQKVKFYGVTTRQRIAALPDAPTLDEQGLKDFEVLVWHGVYAPKGTPKETLDRLNVALRAALKDPNVASKFAELGAQVVPEAKQSPAGLRDWLRAEIDKWQPVIRKAGVYAD